jgi:hypothetical protein
VVAWPNFPGFKVGKTFISIVSSSFLSLLFFLTTCFRWLSIATYSTGTIIPELGCGWMVLIAVFVLLSY